MPAPIQIARDLNRISALADSADPGPWEVDSDSCDIGTYVMKKDGTGIVCEVRGFGRNAPQQATKEFIADARQSVPNLIFLIHEFAKISRNYLEIIETDKLDISNAKAVRRGNELKNLCEAILGA